MAGGSGGAIRGWGGVAVAVMACVVAEGRADQDLAVRVRVVVRQAGLVRGRTARRAGRRCWRVALGGVAVPVRVRICAVASAAVLVACSQIALRSPAVRSGRRRPGVARSGVHRCRSLGQVRSAASFPPPYQTGPPVLAVSPGSATEYPVT